ncbi:MAG: tripartite tricarboxylate transporter substrate binding protein, partial [Alphaproteobacteria bacterium]|nr:tripartite tricarboxylate transporter substrate binding protein [Alphaproteobacteria bacterium]
LALWSGASAETYPSHPIKVIVPYPPGGNTDLVGRMFAQRLGEISKVSVVIENRGGGGGTIGVDAAARAEPDGYTLLHATNSELAVVPAVQPNLPYDPIKNLIAISTTCEFPFVLVTRKDLPVQSVQDLVALARQKPGTLTFASVGVGSANHLVIEPFKALFHVDVVHVPYKGGGPAANDLLGGHVDASFATLSSILAQVQSGDLRALLVTSKNRVPQLPEVPSAGELGLSDLIVNNWNAFLVPAGTPAGVVDRLHDAIVEAGNEPAMIASVRQAGAEISTSTPAAASALLAADLARWTRIAKNTGIKIE